MGSRQPGSIGLQAGVQERTGSHDLPQTANDGQPLEVNVLSTTYEGAVAALKSVLRVEAGVGARVTVRLLYVVPSTLPLDTRALPPGYVDETTRALKQAVPMDIRVVVHPCRDPLPTAREILVPHSLVFVGGRGHWWPSEARRLAQRLRKDGHRVFFAESR